MKKYFKETAILFIQLFIFYIFPLAMYLYEPIGTIMIIIFVTLTLSIMLSIISKNKIKYLYPIIISILFVPSVFIYYNESALIHSVWYLVTSVVGILVGAVINLLIQRKSCR